MSSFRRGFKAQSERKAVEVRKTLNFDDISPLSATILAEHLGVLIWSVNNVPGVDASDLHHLLVIEPDGLSAFTLRIGERYLVVFNPSQSDKRVNSVIMHELAHIMLGHRLASAGTSEDGHLLPSNYDQDQEAEADWLGGTLLLPRPALLWMRKQGMTAPEATEHFQVSTDMLNWRIRMTGVDHQLKHSWKKRS